MLVLTCVHYKRPAQWVIGDWVNRFSGRGRVLVQDYSMSMYLRQQWIDSRLSFDRAANHNSTMLKLEDNTWNRIWIPEVVFRNEKTATFHDVTTANRMMRLHDDGTVWYVFK